MTGPANQLVEHFFRHESANLIAVLTRAFGIRRIDLIEDMVQVSMIQAMEAWKQNGPPEKPAAWLHRVAKNRVLDVIRRESIHAKAVALSGHSHSAEDVMIDEWLDESRMPDSLLRMIFVCCHPGLSRASQLGLALKTLCGFSVAEISRGLMLPVETVKKRLQRAKKSLADMNVQVELPSDDQVATRIGVVHDVLYLMFNEGHSTSHGVEPVRDDICEEAARLCHILCGSAFATPDTMALLALMLLHASRFDARVDSDGVSVLLEDQDRSRWDARLIEAGQHWLLKSRTDAPSRFHLEGLIALQHCIAESVDTTDWSMIAQLYSSLHAMHPSPLYLLNRAIAVAQTGKTAEALDALTRLRDEHGMSEHVLLWSAVGRIHSDRGELSNAEAAYRTAYALSTTEHEKAILARAIRRVR